MSDSAVKPAGTYELVKFLLTPMEPGGSGSESKDIKLLVHTWSIKEAISSGHISGSAKVYDSVGVFYTMPMRGQERLTIEYKDYNGEVRQEDMFVYSVTDLRSPKSSDDAVLEYTIHFASFGKFWSERFSVQRCIANGTKANRRYIPVSEQVQV